MSFNLICWPNVDRIKFSATATQALMFWLSKQKREAEIQISARLTPTTLDVQFSSIRNARPDDIIIHSTVEKLCSGDSLLEFKRNIATLKCDARRMKLVSMIKRFTSDFKQYNSIFDENPAHCQTLLTVESFDNAFIFKCNRDGILSANPYHLL